MLISTKNLMHYSLHATDGTIGEVIDVWFDKQWHVRYLAADTGRWLPGRHILISTVSLHTPGHASRLLPVELTREQVRQSPGIELGHTVTRRYESDLHHHYRWPVYWGNSSNPVTHPEHPDAYFTEQDESRGHLMSARDLIGFRISASDDGIGHVDDILLDVTDWRISYLVAGTRNILRIKETLLHVETGVYIDWNEELVALDFTRETIMNAPPYVSPDEIDAGYEAMLSEYYSHILH